MGELPIKWFPRKASSGFHEKPNILHERLALQEFRMSFGFTETPPNTSQSMYHKLTLTPDSLSKIRDWQFTIKYAPDKKHFALWDNRSFVTRESQQLCIIPKHLILDFLSQDEVTEMIEPHGGVVDEDCQCPAQKKHGFCLGTRCKFCKGAGKITCIRTP